MTLLVPVAELALRALRAEDDRVRGAVLVVGQVRAPATLEPGRGDVALDALQNRGGLAHQVVFPPGGCRGN